MHLLYRLRLKHIHGRVANFLIFIYFKCTCIYSSRLTTILPHRKLNLIGLMLLVRVRFLIRHPFPSLKFFELLGNLIFTGSTNGLSCCNRAGSPLFIYVLDCQRRLLLDVGFILERLCLNSITFLDRIIKKFDSLKLLVVDCVVSLKLLDSLNEV